MRHSTLLMALVMCFERVHKRMALAPSLRESSAFALAMPEAYARLLTASADF